MKRIGRLSMLLVIASLAALPVLGDGLVFATPSNYNDPNFRLLWERTDKPVQDGLAARSWMWGPQTIPGSPASEPYVDSPGSTRTVQYFDKSRMEVINPNGDRASFWFVTNGLLVREMVSGLVQTGDMSFLENAPAQEAVAGDPASLNPNCPTYASFVGIASLNSDNPSPAKATAGDAVDELIDKAGNITKGASPDPGVRYLYYDDNLKHNIPNVFFDFMQEIGPVYRAGVVSEDKVLDWVFALGFPLTDPYWTKAKVAGVEKDILVQLFERRVLTYTPSNPEGYKVEMGNVGQHYLRWRYGGEPTPTAEQRIVFVSNRTVPWQIWTMNTSGGDQRQLTTLGENYSPSWSPDNSKIVFTSTRDGTDGEIYVMNGDGSNQTRLTLDPSLDFQPTWSPDGNHIIWCENGDIYTMAVDGSEVQLVTDYQRSFSSSPIFAPDGQRLAWASHSDGERQIFRANIDGTNRLKIAFDLEAGAVLFPSDWYGSVILYSDWSESKAPGIWSTDENGGNKKQLVSAGFGGARFSPDGAKIVYAGQDGILVANADGTNPMRITSGYQDFDADWTN